MQKVVKIKKLNVILGEDVKAIDDITLSISEGKITGLIGPSGAGKTTLLRAIVGRVVPADGTIEVFGLKPGSKELRNKVSYMTQEVSVYQDITVSQNLEYFAALFGSRSEDMIENTLRDVELLEKADNLVKNLSGGQKQRVSLAVSLIGGHELMILDEPTTGLDPVLRAKLWKLFNRLRNTGTTIIISSHAMDEAQKCDKLILIRDGRVIADSEPYKILKSTKSKTIEESFLKLVGGEA